MHSSSTSDVIQSRTQKGFQQPESGLDGDLLVGDCDSVVHALLREQYSTAIDDE